MLFEVLEARERRAARQQEMLRQFSVPLVSCTMNIPGPVKYTPAVRRAFDRGMAALEAALPAERVRSRETTIGAAGCEAIWAADLEPLELKRICTALEDGTEIGRLYDFDVLDCAGRKLEREAVNGKSRDCIVCGKPGRGCAASRAHSVAELQAAVSRILERGLFAEDAARISEAAVESLRDEVFAAPKPGLVDRNNTGCHRDMNYGTFLASAEALRPYFCRCVELGHETAEKLPSQLFSLLRQEGIAAEKAMYAATGGVNTHKGIVYTMGILCGAIGRSWKVEQPITAIDALLRLCAEIAGPAVAADLTAVRERGSWQTAGERLYLQYGLTGVRGQIANGLPAIREIGLPVYEASLRNGCTPNDAACITLVHLIAGTEDTNLWHRSGEEGAVWARKAATSILAGSPYPTMEQIKELDDSFIERNLSPGGCADLLAVTLFLRRLLSGTEPTEL